MSKANMRIDISSRRLLIIALTSTLALAACDRKSETHDPDVPDTPTNGEQQMDDTTTGGDSTYSGDTTGAGDDTGAASATGDDSTSSSTDSDMSGDQNTDAASATGDSVTGGEEVLICTKEWFEWVNNQVMATNSEMIAEQYPTGLPDVGTDEWFMAVDKLTGGDGAHGPDGGSDEWCMMVQQRLKGDN